MGLGPDFTHQVGVVQHGQLVMEGHAVAGGLVIHAFKAPHEIQVPEGSPELAVGDHVIAQLLLLGHHLGDFLIDDFIKRGLVNLPGAQGGLRVLQGLRPQEASHKIIPEGCL